MKRKSIKKAITFLTVCILVSLMVLSNLVISYNDQKAEENTITEQEEEYTEPIRYKDEKEVIPINLTTDFDKSIDLEQEDPYKDENGNLTVPFDVAYPEVFESGEVQYDERSLLIKVRSGKDVSEQLKQCGVESLREMFTVSSGTWYEGFVKERADIIEIMGKVRSADDVLEAEYNFLWETAEEETGESETDEGSQAEDPMREEQWYLDSYGIQEAWQYQTDNELPVAGASTTVAVIDTGVDFDHEDLYANMWINQAETPDNGIDDDGNGYIDDYYGVDIVNGQGSANDDNGHGTHVAGIIAAAKNQSGTLGVAYNSKIMAIKAGSASGYFLQSHIADAIVYAYRNGADIINMSFGGSASSIAVQDALELAYTNCVLVAAAGNSGLINEYIPGYVYPVIPSYPAAFPYVIGVMSVDSNGVESSFTNFDGISGSKVEYEVYAPGSEILSTIPNDKYASWSGTSMATPVISAMAANIRADYLDRSAYPSKYIYGQIISTGDESALCGNPIAHSPHNKPLIANAYNALTKIPTPDVYLSDHTVFDSQSIDSGNNGDGVIDSGEVLSLGFDIWNKWGLAKDATVTISAYSAAGIANPYVSFAAKADGEYGESASINYGDVGTYSTKDAGKVYDNDLWIGWQNPFYVKVADNCPNDMIITIGVEISCGNGLDETDTNTYVSNNAIELKVRNGYILPSVINEDMTLTADNYYILSSSVYIPEGVTVNVEPGTQMQFWTNDSSDPYVNTKIAFLKVDGMINFNGTEKEHIKLFPSELMDKYIVQILGNANFRYCDITNPYIANNVDKKYVANLDHCYIDQNYNDILHYRNLSGDQIYESSTRAWIEPMGYVTNSVFYKLGGGDRAYFYGRFDTCSFIDSSFYFNAGFNNSTLTNCMFYGNNTDFGSAGYSSRASIEISKPDTVPITVDSIVKDEISGTTYAVVKFSKFYINFDMLDSILEHLGGTVVAFENESEYNFVKKAFFKSNSSDYYLYQYILVDENGKATDINGKPVSINKKLSEGKYLTCSSSYANSTHYINEDFKNYEYNSQQTDKFGYQSICYLIIEIPGDIYVTDIGLEQGSVTIDESTQYQIISAPYPESDQSLIYEFADDITGENHNISFDKTEHMKWSLAKDEENGSYRIMLNDFLSKAGDLYLKYDDGFVLDGYDEENKDAYKFSFYKWDGIIPEGDPPAQEEPSPEEGEPSTGEEEPVEPEVKYLNFVLSDSLDCGDEVLIYHPSSGRCLAYGHTDYKANGFPETPDENNTIAIGLGTLDQSLMEWGVNINEDGSYSFLRGEWSYTENEDGTRTLAEVSGCLGGSEVVSVDTNGMIEPISIGSADIYVYSEDRGVYSIFTANVKEEVKLTSIDASVEKDRLNVGESIRVSYKLEPSETTNKSVYFTSSDESVATVDSIGRITALSPGNTAIKVTSSKDEQIYDTVDITVIKQVENMYYSETTYMTNLDKEDGHDFYPEIYPSDYTESLIWTSSNPEIAYVDNETGELVKTKNGTAKLKVMSECSGLSSEIFVGVSDFESDAMLVKMQSIYCSGGIFYIFALFDNGELWTWGGDRYTTPVRINCGDRFIKDFAVQNYLYILDQDGTVYKSDDVLRDRDYANDCSMEKFFTQVKKIESTPEMISLNYPVCAIREDGTLWFWGNNGYGVFGDGTYTSSDTPVQAEIYDVKDVLINHEYNALILKENNELYITGGLQTRYNLPTLIEDNASSLLNYNRDQQEMYFCTEEQIFRVDNAGIINAEYNDVFGSHRILLSDSYYYIENGQLFVMSNINTSGELGLGTDLINTYGEFVKVDGLENVAYVFSASGTTFVQTTDGSLYGMGDNSSHQLIDFTTQPSYVPKRMYFGLKKNYDELQLESTNLENGTLKTDEVDLVFNEALIKGTDFKQITLTDQTGDLASVNKTIDLNRLLISKVNGFTDGEQYTLTIPANALNTPFANSNNETISLSFTYQKTEHTTPIEDGTEEESIQPDSEIEGEKPQTFVNGEVSRFYWDNEKLGNEVIEAQKHGRNIYFCNNAIINRLDDKDIEEHWLSVIGMQSTEYKVNSISNNYWGTSSETLVEKQHVDFDDYSTLTDLYAYPILETPPAEVWPFVTNAGVMNADGEIVNSVGNETVTFFVEFNRPMDTSVDLDFRFGSAYPYGDYSVLGEWVSDQRWEGNATIATTIESGTQFMSIANAYSGDEEHLQFFKDWGRFPFSIDMSSALSMNLHGNATDTGIELTWYQDDFDTLIGYNVYRSDKEDGYYQRLNSTIIPVGEEEFFDKTVEPGQLYYYNFTVVKSDLSESTPSGKIVIRSKDTMAPNIYHTPVYTAYTGSNLVISATVVDNVMVQRVRLHYRIAGTENWIIQDMNKSNDKYYGIIPSSDVTLDGIEYCIEAYDGVSYTYSRTPANPYVVTVKQSIGNDALGDVDGDGKITNKDALMIIQAVNDLLNLTEEQFLRADINKDKELSSAEALIILKYVSGKITSITA